MASKHEGLSERKKLILKAIVEAHIAEGEPVGSKSLMANQQIVCSSATIRNEMAELEEMGYLVQPHTSAGRVPSELGYRFYVDSLIEHYAMTAHDIKEIGGLLKSKMHELDEVLLAASRVASNLTNYTGIAIKPRASAARINRFEIIYIRPTEFIVVMVAASSDVKTKSIHTEVEITADVSAHLSSVLNSNIAGLTSHEINLPIIMNMESEMGQHASLVSPVIKAVYETLNELDDGEVRWSGIDQLLQYPEFEDRDTLKHVLGALEGQDEILDLVSAGDREDVNVVFGAGGMTGPMNNSAMVYKHIVKDGKTVGAIGIIGPRRMDYAKVLATLESLTGNIADMLGEDTKLLNGGTPNGTDTKTDG